MSGIPNESRSYIVEHGSGALFGEAVHREYVNRRKQRVERAQAALDAAERGDFDFGSAPDRRRVALAQQEVSVSSKCASNHAGDLVRVPVVSVCAARAWPNALPGGTSPRRAAKRRRDG